MELTFRMMNTHRNYSLDTLRGISCIFVILIHYPFPGVWGAIIKSIGRTAIPFFFMLSGYYTNKNDINYTRTEIIKRVKKTTVICTGALVFSLLMEYIFFFREQSVYAFIKSYFDIDIIMRLIIWNDTGNINHLWFLFALLYCYLFLYILISHTSTNDYRAIDITAFLLWVGLIIFTEILPASGHNTKVFYYRNAFLTGFPFFWFGFRLKTKPFARNINYRFAFFFGIGLIIIERLLIGNIENSLGITLLSAVTFIEACNNPSWGGHNFLAALGREYSLLIYILHWYVIYVEYKIIDELRLFNIEWYSSISPILVILYSVAAAIVVKKTLLLVKGSFHKC